MSGSDNLVGIHRTNLWWENLKILTIYVTEYLFFVE